jgi:FK506-binding protein 1
MSCSNKGCEKTTQADGKPLLKCQNCLAAVYCSRDCQKADWNGHKGPCKAKKHELDLAKLVLTTSKEGDGKTFPQTGDVLSMHYVGTLASNGKQFDSSRDRNEPFEFTIGVGEVIQGWDLGVMKMSLGQRAKLYIPSDLGYGKVCLDFPLLVLSSLPR